MKSYIWEKPTDMEDDFSLIVDESDVKNVADFFDTWIYQVCKANQADVATLEKQFDEYLKKNQIAYNEVDDIVLQNFIDEIGIDFEVRRCDDLQTVSDDPDDDLILYYDDDRSFLLLSECDTERAASMWDGHNFVDIICDEETGETEVEYDADKRYCLDEWDGHNNVTGGIGHHEYVYQIEKIDGEKVENQYLVVRESQWQGEFTQAKIFDVVSLQEYLKSIGRDFNDVHFD